MALTFEDFCFCAQHLWKKDSTLVAHLGERDLASHLSRALETCLKGTGIPAQASPMIVRSVCSPQIVLGCPPSLRPSPGGGEGIGALLTAAGISGGAGGLAAALAMRQPSPVPEKTSKSEPLPENAANAQAAKKSRSEDKVPEAKTQSVRGVTDRPDTPERKEVQLSTATTPLVDKSSNKLHILKQLTSVARGLWRRVSKVITQLCRALQVSESSLNRALKVANRIMCSIKARELLYDRHLHQLLMCVVFAACRVEDPDKVLFRKIINQHHALYAHLQLNEQIYWMLEIGPAANQTGLRHVSVCSACTGVILPGLCSSVCRQRFLCGEWLLLAAHRVTQTCAGNLIEFYNKKFIPLCKEFVLEDACLPSPAQSRPHMSGTGAVMSAPSSASRLPPRLYPCRPSSSLSLHITHSAPGARVEAVVRQVREAQVCVCVWVCFTSLYSASFTTTKLNPDS